MHNFSETTTAKSSSSLSSSSSSSSQTNPPLVYVIEFNPWNRFTSACLFHWVHDTDILEGRADFQFRILDAPLEVLRSSSLTSALSSSSVPASRDISFLGLEGHDSHAEDPFSSLDPEMRSEFSDILNMVHDHMHDDMERINSNLRYVLNKRMKNI
eukprot:TRINITY_DN11271_c0_g1_i1.p1 TRINITY_DN11271_c0_g1~~TRINITY_DN11271_c0_g1_i1.p1  ORF type:complete len:181 (+),score=41.26 TRINITY_DN11271_c0_g1_i1:76-543(+)